MAKKKWKQPKQKYNGFVYIIKIEIGPEIIYKIGTTNRTPVVRMLEIAEELHKLFAYIPKMMLIRQKQTKDNYKVEAEILKLTNAYSHTLMSEGIMCGESELRKMNECELLKIYDRCLLMDYPPEVEFKVEL